MHVFLLLLMNSLFCINISMQNNYKYLYYMTGKSNFQDFEKENVFEA